MSWVSDILDEDSFSDKVLLKVAVIKETRRLLPNFQITYTIAATVILKLIMFWIFLDILQ